MRSTTKVSTVALFTIILFVDWWCFVAAGKDFYSILGVPRSAEQKQISKAYRELSRKYHPDKNPGDKEAENKFVEISNAYDVLSDPDKRRTYDMYGEEGLTQQGGGHGGFHDPFDIFAQHFGGGNRQQQQHSNKKPEIVIPLEVTLEDLYNGATHRLSHKKQILCTKCRGLGTKNANDLETCPDCRGKGVKIQTHQIGPGFVQQIQTVCDKCSGKGRIAKSKCPHCKGTKIEQGEDVLTMVIERGMGDGSRIIFEGEGDESPDTQPGDVVFEIVTAPHHRFTRKGNDLQIKIKITLLEALVGFKRTFKHLDGHEVVLERSEITTPGFIDVIYEEGMPQHNFPSLSGNLLVEYTIEFPKSLTESQRSEISKILSK
eukprot:TRINITY_DN3519_c0_g1_i1.p1 TRINITY_DN3519_c0_g1~~TRINITY_DN3519_c0_g1_i1.p1  ORF type:complete len:374 (-),score=47.89 TRINITY_DN3519_c0_g1_i1:38-1159(-)